MTKPEMELAKAKIFTFIQAYTAKHGFCPTNSEIAIAYNRGRKAQKSLGAIQHWVRQLITEGKLKKTAPRKGRNITL